ncbi:MAG: PLP-dependent aminotransferase family protein [Actinomycetota bacterium]
MSEFSLDPYVDRYASRTLEITASEVRALFAVASRPEVISLAGGMPYTAAVPFEALERLCEELLTDRGPAALQYTGGQGEPALRERLCEIMAEEHITAHPEDVVVTAGSQQALDLLARIFCDPGDVVLAEAPSYTGALSAFSQYQIQVVHLPMDGDGLRVDALVPAVKDLRARGKRVKFLYTVPNFHNPAGVSLALERRGALLETTASLGVLVVEDNPYGLLGFDGQILPALRSIDPGNVIYLGTISKILAPGLRIGWVLAPPPIREKLIMVKGAADLCSPAFNQLLTELFFRRYPWRDLVKEYRGIYRERMEAMVSSLGEHMPEGTRWTVPKGGFFVWVVLPDGLDAKKILPRAISARVAYVPGTGFFADGQGRNALRLCYSLPPPERIREGVRRLAGVVREELALYRALIGGGAP